MLAGAFSSHGHSSSSRADSLKVRGDRKDIGFRLACRDRDRGRSSRRVPGGRDLVLRLALFHVQRLWRLLMVERRDLIAPSAAEQS
jgi:hypothetical protein